MTDSNALVSIEQREVAFYDDLLTAVRSNDAQVYVAIRQMCLSLGLNAQAQRRRMDRHTVLSDGLKVVAMMATTTGKRDSYVLRVDLVPLWLSSIDTNRVTDEAIRFKLEHYQREAAKVLWEAFQDGRLTADSSFDELLQNDSEAVQAYKMAAAIMKLARTQILIQARLENSETQLLDHEHRLEQIETQLGSGSTITPDQATAISQAVKTVARALGQQTGRNEYGGVYGELYRRYRIPTYRELPSSSYDDAIGWLGDWLESLTGENPF